MRAEGQFALVHRPLVPPAPKTDWAEPPDPTHHTLGAVAVGALALLTKGLPEYEARPTRRSGAELCLTLLRCVGVISQPGGVLATRPCVRRPADCQTPDGQCLGRHELEYALLPGADELDDAVLLRVIPGLPLRIPDHLATGPTSSRRLKLDGDVVFSCLKGAEDGDGLILRCFNPNTSPASVKIAGEFDISRARLDESEDEGARGVELRPGEIATFRLRPSDEARAPGAG